jgi:transposase InsO family protein
MGMIAIEQYDIVHFKGVDYQVQAVRPEKVVLRSLRDGRTTTTTLDDLLSSMATAAGHDSLLFFAERFLETLPRDEAKEVRNWYRHLTELATGVDPYAEEGAPSKDQYCLDLPLYERMESKRQEMTALGIKVSTRNLQRKLTAYRKDGIAGLIDARSVRQSSRTGRVPDEIVAIAEELIASQTMRSTRTKSYLADLIHQEAVSRGVEGLLPSRSTLYRLLSKLSEKQHTFGSAMTRRTTANSKATRHRTKMVRFPGESMEIDSTPLDVMTILPNGDVARAELTTVIDVATRSLCAWIIKPRGTKAVDAVELLARTMTPMRLQPGFEDRMAMAHSILASSISLSDDEVSESLAAKPVIKPHSLTVDRGKVFVSDTFMRACARLGIQVVKASPYTPTDKPHVERTFATINSLFTQYLPGYVGKNPAFKGKDPTKEPLLTLDQVRTLFDHWVVCIYQNRPHDGLRLPLMPKKLLSPNQMYVALAEVYPQEAVTFTRDDYVGLLPMKWRTIKRDGITFEGLRYDSSALNPFRSVKSGNKRANGKWEVRYDPNDLTRIWLRVPDESSFVEVTWVFGDLLNESFGIETLQAARKVLDQREPKQVDLLLLIQETQSGSGPPKGRPGETTGNKSRPQSGKTAAGTPSQPSEEGSGGAQNSTGEESPSEQETEVVSEPDTNVSVDLYPIVKNSDDWW